MVQIDVAAKARFGCAITLDAKFRALALDDVDLTPLWDSLGAE